MTARKQWVFDPCAGGVKVFQNGEFIGKPEAAFLPAATTYLDDGAPI